MEQDYKANSHVNRLSRLNDGMSPREVIDTLEEGRDEAVKMYAQYALYFLDAIGVSGCWAGNERTDVIDHIKDEIESAINSESFLVKLLAGLEACGWELGIKGSRANMPFIKDSDYDFVATLKETTDRNLFLRLVEQIIKTKWQVDDNEMSRLVALAQNGYSSFLLGIAEYVLGEDVYNAIFLNVLVKVGDLGRSPGRVLKEIVVQCREKGIPASIIEQFEMLLASGKKPNLLIAELDEVLVGYVEQVLVRDCGLWLVADLKYSLGVELNSHEAMAKLEHDIESLSKMKPDSIHHMNEKGGRLLTRDVRRHRPVVISYSRKGSEVPLKYSFCFKGQRLGDRFVPQVYGHEVRDDQVTPAFLNIFRLGLRGDEQGINIVVIDNGYEGWRKSLFISKRGALVLVAHAASEVNFSSLTWTRSKVMSCPFGRVFLRNDRDLAGVNVKYVQGAIIIPTPDLLYQLKRGLGYLHNILEGSKRTVCAIGDIPKAVLYNVYDPNVRLLPEFWENYFPIGLVGTLHYIFSRLEGFGDQEYVHLDRSIVESLYFLVNISFVDGLPQELQELGAVLKASASTLRHFYLSRDNLIAISEALSNVLEAYGYKNLLYSALLEMDEWATSRIFCYPERRVVRALTLGFISLAGTALLSSTIIQSSGIPQGILLIFRDVFIPRVLPSVEKTVNSLLGSRGAIELASLCVSILSSILASWQLHSSLRELINSTRNSSVRIESEPEGLIVKLVSWQTQAKIVRDS